MAASEALDYFLEGGWGVGGLPPSREYWVLSELRATADLCVRSSPLGRGYLGDDISSTFTLFLKHLPFATAPLDVTLFTSSDAYTHFANCDRFIHDVLG